MEDVAVPVALHVGLHVVLQGTLRNVKGVAVPAVPHVVLQGTPRNVMGVVKREEGSLTCSTAGKTTKCEGCSSS